MYFHNWSPLNIVPNYGHIIKLSSVNHFQIFDFCDDCNSFRGRRIEFCLPYILPNNMIISCFTYTVLYFGTHFSAMILISLRLFRIFPVNALLRPLNGNDFVSGMTSVDIWSVMVSITLSTAVWNANWLALNCYTTHADTLRMQLFNWFSQHSV